MHAGYIVSKLDSSVRLTPRCVQIVRLLSLGSSVKQVAAQLGLSPYTVAEHAAHAQHVLGARNRADTIRLVIEHGFIPPPPATDD
jgi:DNA-binding NarL/FixJ family response regulator